MKIIAICPHCHKQVPRIFLLKIVPHKDLSCPFCSETFRTESKLEWFGSFLIGAAIILFYILGSEGFITWLMALSGISLSCLLGVVAFPYITKFVTLGKN